MANMGFDFGLAGPYTCFKRKNRFLLYIPNISADDSQVVNCLPPAKSARPNISFKEIEVQHLTETLYFPGRPEWKPLELSLYDIRRRSHPVFNWLSQIYNPGNKSQGNQAGTYNPSCDGFKKQQAILFLYDGCGAIIEKWVYENVYPISVEFGELSMDSSDVVMCDVSLRYDRAYIDYNF